jgi:predicted transcriptional regulator
VATTSVAHLLYETVLTRRQAADLLRVSPAAVTNYLVRGVHGVKLEGVLVGGTWRTSAEAVDRFVDAQTEKVLGPRASRPTCTARQARRASEQAMRELEAAGW